MQTKSTIKITDGKINFQTEESIDVFTSGEIITKNPETNAEETHDIKVEEEITSNETIRSKNSTTTKNAPR